MTQSLDVNSYLNRIEYLEEGNRTLKKKLNDLTEEKMKMELNYKSKLQLEKEKTSILQRRIDESHQEVSKSNNKIKVLSNMNKNLLIEIKSLNGLLDETNSNREQLLFLLDYYKTEDELK